MSPAEAFRHCPRCGQPHPHPGAEPFRCAACEFLFYFNPASAAGAILQGVDGRVLLVRRAKDPHKGKLTIPGGFIDMGEEAEAALRREIREEVGLTITRLDYLCSQPNQYHYQEVTYSVLDLFFFGQAPAQTAVAEPGEVAEICWLSLSEINLEEIAFTSVREALRRFIAARG